MADNNARLALVTGAGQGIGAAVTGQLVSEGMRVIAMEKRADLLDGLEIIPMMKWHLWLIIISLIMKQIRS